MNCTSGGTFQLRCDLDVVERFEHKLVDVRGCSDRRIVAELCKRGDPLVIITAGWPMVRRESASVLATCVTPSACRLKCPRATAVEQRGAL